MMKAADIHRIKLFIILVFCYKFVAAKSEHVKISDFSFEKIKVDLFSDNHNVSELLSETTSPNYTGYRTCFNELNSIKNGLDNVEEWAVRLFDAWGKVPSDVLSGNLVDFGGFSQCFHVNRHDQLYNTQYCMGQLLFNSEKLTAMMDKNLFIGLPSLFPNIGVSEPGFSFGLCLPAACSVEHVELILNKVAETKWNVSLKILKNTCQKEESTSELKTIDLAVIYFLLFVLFLIVASTSYDIICTVKNRNKFQPFIVFSFYTNGKKLFTCQKSISSDTIECLHGIRAISAQWILFGHTFVPYSMFPARNKATLITLFLDYYSVVVTAGPIVVDTFLVLSGFLVSLNLLKQIEKNGKINLPTLYLHRYVRLTPLLAVVFLVSMTLMRFLGDGPVWPIWIQFFSKPCETYWWSTLLYVQNYVNPRDFCLVHTWYLSADMQLFIVAPIIIYLIYRFKSKTIFGLVVLVLFCMWLTVTAHIKYGLKTLREEGKLETAYYPTHMRFSTWLVGVIGGYILFECRKKSVHIPKAVNLLAWTLSFTLMLVALLALYPLQQLDTKALPIHFGLYDAFSRVAWSIAVCYIIIACALGFGGPINWFLSHPRWQPFSRLCYSTNLLHFPIIMGLSASIKSSFFFDKFKAVLDSVGVYTFTIFLSIIAFLAIETPFLLIENLIFKPKVVTQSEKIAKKRSKRKVL